MSIYWTKTKLIRVDCYKALGKQLRNKLLIYGKNSRYFFLDNEILALLPISNTKTSIVWSIKKDVMNKYKNMVIHIESHTDSRGSDKYNERLSERRAESTYDYFIHLYKEPVLGKYSSYYELENLDFNAMKKAAALIPLYNNFEAVCKQPHLHNHTICYVTHAKVFVDPTEKRLRFTVTANRFLRGMIRLLVSFLLRIGTGKMTLSEFEKVLSEQLNIEDKKPAFANGLYLSGIAYPYLNLSPTANICSFLKKELED